MALDDLPIHEAARNDPEELAALLQANPALLEAPAFKKATPLIIAVKANNIDSVKILIEAGANPNATNEEGVPPAFSASSRAALELLKKAGAKFDVYSERGFGFEYCAAYVRSLEALQFWWEQGFSINHNSNDFYPAIIGVCAIDYWSHEPDYKPEIEIIEFLVEHGADVNLQHSTNGYTALITACWRQSLPLVRRLLELGADPNLANHHGENALVAAVERKNEKLVDLLLEYGADSNQLDKYFVTPLDRARKLGFHLSVLEPLAKQKPEKPIPSVDEIVTRLQSISSLKKSSFEGCSDDEIDELEAFFKLKLPSAYRHFLKLMGKGYGEFLASDNVFFEYKHLFEIGRCDSYEMHSWFTDKTFVVAERDGGAFFYFEADGASEDPPVFRFIDDDEGSKQMSRTFWEFVELLLIDYEVWELSK